jgi:segregation and condensation protein B
MNLDSKIEGLLFYKGEDMTIKKIADVLGVSIDEVTESIKVLSNKLADRGIVLVQKDDSVVLGINGELSPVIESIRKDEISKELSKSALETLSIVLYKNNISRTEIDYIRGVNSSFILRNLVVRGLVEKVLDANDTRRTLYRPTINLLSYMGVTSIDQIPNYQDITSRINQALNQNKEND